MPLTSGQKLGPYEILDQLGAGGMGEVYRARDTRLERTVAIKVLHSQVVATADVRARFEREAKVISQLQHPHICTLFDVGAARVEPGDLARQGERSSPQAAGESPASTQSINFLVMEYLEGETLADRL